MYGLTDGEKFLARADIFEHPEPRKHRWYDYLLLVGSLAAFFAVLVWLFDNIVQGI